VAKNQVWDQSGNLIVDEEVPDEVQTIPTVEELTQIIAELTAALNAKGLIP